MTNNLTLTEFIPGGKVKAQEINGNFTTLKDAVELNKNQLDDSVSAINTDIAELEVGVSELENEVEKLISMPNFCMKSGNVDTNGNADLLYAPGIGTAETTFVQSILSSNGTMGESGFAVRCTSIQPGYYAYLACDGNSGTYFYANATNFNYDIYNINALKVSKFSIKNYWQSGYTPLTGNIYVSNDDATYSLLTTFTNSTTSPDAYWDINIPEGVRGFYKYYRINVTSINYNDSHAAIFVDLAITGTYQVSISTATNCFFKVGSSYPGLTLTYADKSQEVLTSLQNIQGLTTNGNYTVIKEKGQNPVAVSSAKVTQGKIFPASPSEGDHHCLTATDLKTYKRVSGAWVETQYVILGNITIAGNVITAVTTNPYNQNGYDINFQTQGYRFPDYANKISKAKNTLHQAESDGYVLMVCSNVGEFIVQAGLTSSLEFGEILAFSIGGNDLRPSLSTPIQKGWYYKEAVNDAYMSMYFVPVKGAN